MVQLSMFSRGVSLRGARLVPALCSAFIILATACAPAAAPAPTSAPAKDAPKPTEAAAKPAGSPAAVASPGAAASPAAGAPAAASAPAAAGPPPAGKPILSSRKTLTYPTVGAGILWNYVPGLIAEAKGFFDAENLTVNVVAVQASAEGCQNLIARAAEIGGCSLNDMIQAVEVGGAPLIEFMAFSGTALQYSIMTRKEITTWPQLKGKTVMVGGPRDNTVFYFRIMARANGLQDNDYDFQFAGASAARFAALKSGAVDASILTDPFDYQAQQEGYPKLDELLPKYLNENNYSGGGPVVRRDWANEHSDELVAYIRAMLRATAWVYDPANKEELFAIMGPKLNAQRENLERSYKRDVVDLKNWSPDGRIKESGVLGVLRSLVDLGSLQEPLAPPTKYYDMTWVEKAHQR